MAEQQAHSRELNYQLRSDILEDVATASMLTQQAKLEGEKLGMAVTQGITKQAAVFGGAIISGAKKSRELKEKFDNGLSRDQFASDEAYDSFRTSLQPDRELYIEAVRTGDVAEQQRILSKLQNKRAYLEGSKEAWEENRDMQENNDYVEDLKIVSMSDQSARATLFENTKTSFETVDNVEYQVIDATQDAMDEIAAIDEMYGESLDHNDDMQPGAAPEVIMNQKINLVESWINGEGIGEYDFYNAKGEKMDVVSGNATSIMHGINNGTITVKRRFNNEQAKELNRTQKKPTDMHNMLIKMQNTLQDGASNEDNPTYFDYEKIRTNLEINLDKLGDPKMLAYNTKSVLGSNFGDDFMARDFGVTLPGEDGVLNTPDDVAGGFSTSIPVTDNTNPHLALMDADNDGMIEPSELANISYASKKILLNEMLKPENKDIFAREFSEWATAKLFIPWERGFKAHDKEGDKLEEYTDAYGNKYITGVKGKDTSAASLPKIYTTVNLDGVTETDNTIRQ
jgi:hypothetical protein